MIRLRNTDYIRANWYLLTIVGDVVCPHDVAAVVAVVEDAAVPLPDDDAPQAHVRSPGEVGRGRRRGDYPTLRK